MSTGEAVDTKQLSAAAESSAAKWIVRIVFGICAVLAVRALNSVDTTMAGLSKDVATLKEGQNKQDVKIAEINGKVDGINTRIDSALIYRMDELQKRIERLEAVSKVP